MDEFNKRLNAAFDTFSDETVEVVIFAYTKNDVDIANSLHGCERYYEGDFSSNDKSQVSDVHEIFAHWLKCGGAPRWFVRFYVANSKSFGVVSYDYGVSATIENQLATGRTDTTARNTVWNFILWYSFCKAQRIKRTKIAILGDDIAAGTNAKGVSCALWTDHCRSAHMKLKACERNFYCDLTFLSRFFVPKGQDNCMVPLIGKALCRFNARANRNSEVSDDTYMCGKSLSYAYEFRHVAYLRDRFLDRARSTGVLLDQVKLHDLTWFARSSGAQTVGEVTRAIREESLVLSDYEFLEVVMAKYDMGLYDMDELCDRLINSNIPEVFEDQRYYKMSHEVE